MLKIEGIAIGDELLDGRVVDSNGSRLAAALRLRGVRLQRVSIVPDDESVMVAALEAARSRADAVVCSGGLGPTDDDRTRHAAARWLGEDLVFDAPSMAGIEARFAAVGIRLTPNNRRQALFPVGAQILDTEVGTAPGFCVCHPEDGFRAFFLPGVPREYDWFLKRHVLPDLVGDEEGRLSRATLKIFGIGESAAEHALSGLTFEDGLTLGYRAHFPEIHLTLTAWSDRDDDGSRMVSEAREQLLGRLGRFLVAEGDETLAQRLGQRLSEQAATVTVAESCTGGLVSKMITDVPGSSGWFAQGIVTYSNEAKARLLGVEVGSLETEGAVSRAVVVQMARGAAASSGADYALAASGIAGPGGGTPEKPVGTVDIACHGPSGTFYRRLSMRAYWGRERIRRVAAHHCLTLLLKVLEGRHADDPKVQGPF